MQNYIEKNTCEICDENGSEVSKINYTDPKIKDFFMKFYGPIGTELLYKFIQNIQYTLILCENCQYLWQKNHKENKTGTKEGIFSKKVKDSSFVYKGSDSSVATGPLQNFVPQFIYLIILNFI